MSTSSSKSTGSGSGDRDLHAELDQARRDGDTAKVAELDAQIAAERQGQRQSGTTQQ